MSKIDDAAEVVENLTAALEQGPEDLKRGDIELVPVPSEYREPWDRRDGESELDYARFLHYRDQGPGRTVIASHIHFFGERELSPTTRYPNGTRRAISYETSKKGDWKARAAQWDEDQERQYQLARSQAIREMVSRHEDQVERAIDSLMVPIEALSLAIQTDPDFMSNLSKQDARKLISISNQAARTIPSLMSAERLARGMPTEIVGGTVDHRHVVSVERDQIGEILEVLAGAGQLDDGSRSLGSGEIVDAEVVDIYPVPPEDND